MATLYGPPTSKTYTTYWGITDIGAAQTIRPALMK